MNAINLHLFGTSRENLLFHVIMQQICSFFGASRENLLFLVIMQQICTFLARHEKTCFPLKNATNLHLFGTSEENLLFHFKMQQICTFLARHEKTCNSIYECNKFAPFWRVTRKPAFPRNNATNLHVFGASQENLLFHLIMQQICTILARHEKNLLFHFKMQQICTFMARH